jgi:superfamily II DNA or RNA helicase
MEMIDFSKIRWIDLGYGALRPAKNADEYNVHLAALEWALDPTILIHSSEDIQSRVHWNETLEPYEHQVQNLITFCRRAPVALIADDVGLGKTISAGLILSELRTRQQVNRCLVLAPKLLGPQWAEELSSKFFINAEFKVGAELKNSQNTHDVLITTYDSAAKHIEHISGLGFEMLVLDEAHHLRNLYGTPKPPMRALKIRSALEERSFKFVVMLTATPIHNRLWDLYSLVDMLACAKGHVNPFGGRDDFSKRFLEDGMTKARILKKGRQDEFRQLLSQYMVRTRRKDCLLDFPERIVKLSKATPTTVEKNLYQMIQQLGPQINTLSHISLAQSLMSSPHAFLKQIGQMYFPGSCVGIDKIYHSAKEQVNAVKLTGKEMKLLKLLEQLAQEKPSDWRAVIFTSRRETQLRLRDVIEKQMGVGKLGFIRGGQAFENQRVVQKYSEDPPLINVIISTDAGAEGVNLQKGNVVINYDLPWNPMVLEQRIGRVQRLGSSYQHVIVLNLVVSGSVEETVIGRLSEKMAAISSTIGDVEGILETIDPAQGESGDGFEKTIRQLVLDSLEGKNVEEAVAKQIASIEKAKKLYQDEQKEVEESLGKLDRMHHEGPIMPKLSHVRPRLTEKDFTLNALSNSEGTLVEDQGKIIYKLRGSADERICFTREEVQQVNGKFFISGGPKIGLYRAGQPAFERLVSNWSQRAQLLVKNGEDFNHETISEGIKKWLEKKEVSVEFSIQKWQVHEKAFRGDISVNCAANVAHDKYEKLITFQYQTDANSFPSEVFENNLELYESDKEIDSFMNEKDEVVKEQVEADPDFSAFVGFYQKRLTEELKMVEGEGILRKRAVGDYTPSISCRIGGIKGISWAIFDVYVELTIPGIPTNVHLFRVCAWGDVIFGPEVGLCAISGKYLPLNCLKKCEVSGDLCAENTLLQSGFSKLYAKPEYIVKCESTGEYLIKSEARMSDVSGKYHKLTLLRKSASGKCYALPEEMKKCEFCNELFCPDELIKSDVSGKLFFKDKAVQGAGKPLQGHVDEFYQCSETLGYFLKDEVGESDLSNQTAALEFLITSDMPPNRRGLKSEAVICEISGRTLLKDEVKCCVVSQKQVGLDLLGKSDYSGKSAIKNMLVVCEVSGAALVPAERKTCEASGKKIKPDLLSECEASGKFVLSSLLVTSASGERRGLPGEMFRCEWDGKLWIPDEISTCRLSGLQISRNYLKDEVLFCFRNFQLVPAYGDFLSPEKTKQYHSESGFKIKMNDVRSVLNPAKTITVFAGYKGGVFFGMGKRLEFSMIKENRYVQLGALK